MGQPAYLWGDKGAVSKLTNSHRARASCMQEGIKLEEDPETGPNNVDAGDRWRALLAWLFQAACEKGRIPTRLGDHSPHPQRRQEGGD
jgi:hypothetical protein